MEKEEFGSRLRETRTQKGYTCSTGGGIAIPSVPGVEAPWKGTI